MSRPYDSDGPFVGWFDSYDEGWWPTSYDTIEEARADKPLSIMQVLETAEPVEPSDSGTVLTPEIIAREALLLLENWRYIA
jgi:hypothetical protein